MKDRIQLRLSIISTINIESKHSSDFKIQQQKSSSVLLTTTADSDVKLVLLLENR